MMIRRAFHQFTPDSFPRLFASIIRPHLEYCAPVWSPSTIRDITKLEQVQRTGSRWVKGMRGKPYDERLREMRLFPLTYRRMRGDLITLYKILHGEFGCTLTSTIEFNNRPGQRGHSCKLVQQRHDGVPKNVMYSDRVIRQWNALPKNVVEAPTMAAFKLQLDKALGYT